MLRGTVALGPSRGLCGPPRLCGEGGACCCRLEVQVTATSPWSRPVFTRCLQGVRNWPRAWGNHAAECTSDCASTAHEIPHQMVVSLARALIPSAAGHALGQGRWFPVHFQSDSGKASNVRWAPHQEGANRQTGYNTHSSSGQPETSPETTHPRSEATLVCSRIRDSSSTGGADRPRPADGRPLRREDRALLGLWWAADADFVRCRACLVSLKRWLRSTNDLANANDCLSPAQNPC